MIKSLFKWLIICSAVLLLGQIRFGKDTLGELYLSEVSQAWTWTRRGVEQSQLIGSIGNFDLSKWLGVLPKKVVQKRISREPVERKGMEEELTTQDSESLLDLLK